MTSSSMQHQDNKLANRSPTLIMRNGGLQTYVYASSPWKDTIPTLALQTGGVTMMVSLDMQQ
jgi:hypothetical protein